MLTKDNSVLLIIDVQGKLATLMHKHKRLFENINRMIAGAKAYDIPIVWTEQLPDKLGETVPEIKANLEGFEPLIKSSFSCSGGPGFQEKLAELGRKQILVCGIEAHICVYQTCLDLLKDGDYEVHLVSDCTSSRFKSNYYLAMDKLKDAGAQMTSVEMSLFEMQVVAEGDDFKKLVQIVK